MRRLAHLILLSLCCGMNLPGRAPGQQPQAESSPQEPPDFLAVGSSQEPFFAYPLIRPGPGAREFIGPGALRAALRTYQLPRDPLLDPEAKQWRVDQATDAVAEPPEVRGGGCLITGIRLGGQAGDQFIGPTCNSDGTYRTCFYVTGQNLPANNPEYLVVLDDVVYPVAFTQLNSSAEVVVCVTGLPDDVMGVDVFVQLVAGCSLTVFDLYDAPANCPDLVSCVVTGIRLGGQPGDQFVGPTCNTDGTYRTCFYVTGQNLPASNPEYQVALDGVFYPIAFTQQNSSAEVVVCVTGLPDGVTGVDVFVQVAVNCSRTVPDLYDAPVNCPDLVSCFVTGIRLGGQAGDQFIGPTCNNDGTYRTCFYVTGQNLPANNPEYQVALDGVFYPIAFTQQNSSAEVVVCVTGLPDGVTGVDVFVQVAVNCSRTVPDLYHAPVNCPDLISCFVTGIRLGGQAGDQFIGPTCNNDGTYRTCFYVTGQNLPANNPEYQVALDGVVYPIAFTQQNSSAEVVVCVTGLPTGVTGVDVFVKVAATCSLTVPDLYDAPAFCPGGCRLDSLRLAGLPGDAFIGPTCNTDGTYRTCFYVTGVNLPASNPAYLVLVDGVSYPITVAQQLSPTEVVLCATGMPTGAGSVDVLVQLATGCTLAVSDLYDARVDCTPEGCSSGYWKLFRHFDLWPLPYRPTTPFVSVFGPVPGVSNALSFVDVLKSRGGGVKGLMRQAVAALLNAQAGLAYPLAPIEIVSMFQAAIGPGGDVNGLTMLLDSFNNQVCPLRN